MTKPKIPSYRQIKNLLQIIANSQQPDEEYIRVRFNRAGSDFDIVFNFLSDVGLVNTINRSILINNRLLKDEKDLSVDSGLKSVLLKSLGKTKNKQIRSQLMFLDKFHFDSTKYIYRPSTKERLAESEIRNLLVELDLISLNKIKGVYSIPISHEDLLIDLISKKSTSLVEFKNRQNEKETIGTNAELEIFKLEQERLKANKCFEAHEVKHISQSNVSAGYDILSWDINRDNQVVPRYIEVKAISSVNSQFYWTHNELKVARRFRNRFYLYLLPLKDHNEFNIEDLIKIQNPYVNVFENDKEWDKQVDTYMFTGNHNK